MRITEESDHESCRVIVLGTDGSEIYLTSAEGSLRLPEVKIPRWQRVAENVTAAMKDLWGEEAICLFELDSVPIARGSRYLVATHWRLLEKSTTRLRRVRLSDLSENSFPDPRDYTSVQESIKQSIAQSLKPELRPFTRLNWFEELWDWIERTIASRGLRLNGRFRQVNASAGFSLIRFETDGPAVWFKAVGKPNEREFPITLTMARFLSEYVPEVLGTRPDWNGWLMSEAEGISLADKTELSLWQTASSATAKLSIESVHSCDSLLGCGAHDLRAAALAELVSPFMDTIAELMRQQPKVPPPILSPAEVAVLSERIREAIFELKDLGIPDTLGHLDLNPGNIVIAPEACVFLDWAEAYVGHPFLSFQYLLEHFRRTGASRVTEETLTAAYLTPWKDVASPEALSNAMALAPLLAAFAYAAGNGVWRDPERLRDPRFAGYRRALARRMSREANLLNERSTPCLC